MMVGMRHLSLAFVLAALAAVPACATDDPPAWLVACEAAQPGDERGNLCKAACGADELCAGADALVITAIRKDVLEAVPLPRIQDILDYHSSVDQAAQTAASFEDAAAITVIYQTGWFALHRRAAQRRVREIAQDRTGRRVLTRTAPVVKRVAHHVTAHEDRVEDVIHAGEHMRVWHERGIDGNLDRRAIDLGL